MHIMKSYSDLLTEIQLIQEQKELTERELEYWYGIDKDGNGIPLGGTGSYKFGANTSIIQAQKKIQSLRKLNERLKELEYARVRQDILLEQFEGLNYKIAYHRIVDNMTLKEIAEELGYSYQHIRRVWAERCYKDATDTVVNL